MTAALQSMHLPLLTHSEMVCFQRCPREHHYKYRLLRRAQSETHALVFGKLIDECLQVWWGDAAWRAAYVAMAKKLLSLLDDASCPA